MSSVNYMYVIPNSHYWTDLNQIINMIAFKQNLTKEYLLIGLNNSVNKGYEIDQVNELDLSLLAFKFFPNLKNLISYLNEDNEFDLAKLHGILTNTVNIGLNLTNGLKMNKEEVFNRVGGELDYQDVKWNNGERPDRVPDSDKPVSEWINYIEYHLERAKYKVYNLNKEEALDEIRKVTALGTRCLMVHGCPARQLPIDQNNESTVVTGTDTCNCTDCKCKK